MKNVILARLAPLAAALLALGLHGCGGGAGDSTETASTAPSGATSDAAAPAASAAPDEHADHDHADDADQDHAGHDHPVATGTGATPPPAGDGPPGKVEIADRSHDFGSAIEGEVLTHTFHLSNAGEGDLLISQAKPTCGCTVGRLVVQDESGEWVPYEYNQPIPPGTPFELEARLNTRNKKNVAHSKINIFSNDPRGHIALELKAQVSPYFRIDPPNVNFGDLSLSDRVQDTFTVTGKAGTPFLLSLEDRPLPAGMVLDLQPVQPDAEGRATTWKVGVELGEGMTEGRIGYPIHLLSDQQVEGAPEQADGTPAVYTTTAMVSALVKGLISHNPLYLSFGLVRPNQIQSRTLRIESNDPDFTFPADVATRIVAPGVEDQESPYAQFFTTSVRPSGDNKALDVELTLNGMPENMNSSFQGKLVVVTGHPTKEQVEVLFSGVCRGAAVTPNITRQANPNAGGTTADQNP